MLSAKECQQARLSRDPRFDGLFFVLVKSTKIFCRNTCRVKLPLEKNVEYAPSAHQAMAEGFRPCLRCRPDSAPNSPAWQGIHTTVNRAIQLLSTRFEASIENVSDALGISPRYLHKLFSEHLQMSPKKFQIYQQVLLAKDLLQTTSLSVEDIAGAAGLPSARRLQEHVKNHLKLSPSQVRKMFVDSKRKNKAGETGGLHDNLRLRLSYRPPYNWIQLRDFLAKRKIIGNEQISADGFSKTLQLNGKEIDIEIDHVPENHAFMLSFNAEFSIYTVQIVSIVKKILDLDASPILIEQALHEAGLPKNQKLSGLRIPGVANEFEAGCRAILGQQVSVSAAVNKLNELYEYFASKHNQKQFPTPQQLVNDDLLFLKVPKLRRASLLDLAAFFVEKQVLDSSLNLPQCQDINDLLAIKGIGPWTISYIKMRALGDTDICLDSDLVVKQQIIKLQQQGRALNSQAAAPWRSYFTLYLWSIA